MTRLNKKCLIASSGMHAFLGLLLVFGSAFFVAKEKPLTQPKLQFVPSRFIEAALAGGGGNPNLPRTDDVIKGQTLAPVPAPLPKPAAQTRQQDTPPPPPPPKQEPRKIETPPDAKAPKATPKPADVAKPADKPKPRINLADLKPIGPTEVEKARAKAKEEAEAQAARDAARQKALTRQRIDEQFSRARDSLQRGFQSGTKVDVGGPGGEAFANYGALVQAAYEDAWKILPDLSDDDAVTVVRVTIARSGRVVASEILRRSGNASMDKSVQRALDRVRTDGLPPFPDFIRDAERSFTIEFNLRSKRLTG